jgi:hypothetical protein
MTDRIMTCIAGVAIVAALLFAVLWRVAVAGRRETEARLTAAQGSLSVAQGTITQLQQGVEAQNRAIASWQAQAQTQAAAAQRAQAHAETIRQAYETQAQQALLAPAPEEPRQALDWLVGEAQVAAGRQR